MGEEEGPIKAWREGAAYVEEFGEGLVLLLEEVHGSDAVLLVGTVLRVHLEVVRLAWLVASSPRENTAVRQSGRRLTPHMTHAHTRTHAHAHTHTRTTPHVVDVDVEGYRFEEDVSHLVVLLGAHVGEGALQLLVDVEQHGEVGEDALQLRVPEYTAGLEGHVEHLPPHDAKREKEKKNEEKEGKNEEKVSEAKQRDERKWREGERSRVRRG